MTVLESTITCPDCGHKAAGTMPVDFCQYYYGGRLLKPLPGDCCVFCSYGDVPCPPVQEARERCGPPPGLVSRRPGTPGSG